MNKTFVQSCVLKLTVGVMLSIKSLFQPLMVFRFCEVTMIARNLSQIWLHLVVYNSFCDHYC